jgi:hypothetical protein
MPDESYLIAGQARWEDLDDYANQLALEMERAKRTWERTRDPAALDTMQQAIQGVANARHEQQALRSLHQQVLSAEQAQRPAPLSREESAVKPWHKMTLQDSWELANKSKYGCDPDAFKAGINEVIRRRNSGE